MYKRKNGFTLIELLIVVSVIGVLSGITISMINPTKHQNTAKDTVKLSNIEKVIQGIEAYNVAEGIYPNAGGDTPVNNILSLDTSLTTYISNWPLDATYYYWTNTDRNAFTVYVQKSDDSAKYIKYYSGWTATSQIKECTDITSLDSCN